MDNKKEVVEEIINTIEEELASSDSSCTYTCKEGNNISTDIGYIYDWFEEYKEILRERYYQKEE